MVTLSPSRTLASPGFGQGFHVAFDAFEGEHRLREELEADAVAIKGASVEAVVKTTNEVKQLIREYLDANFTGSNWHGGRHRRVSLAAAQSRFYDDIEEKGQYAGLVYSKFGRGKGPSSFVDFLLLHVRGGTVRPKDGDWIKLPASGAPPMIGAQTGFYPSFGGSRIFFAKSPDGQELFLLRKRGKGKNATTQLLATLVKKVDFPASLSGIDIIASRREVIFHGHFAAALAAQPGVN